VFVKIHLLQIQNDCADGSLKEYKSLTRKDVDGILERVFPNTLTDSQKKTKANHLLSKLRKDGKIINIGNTAKPTWILKK